MPFHFIIDQFWIDQVWYWFTISRTDEECIADIFQVDDVAKEHLDKNIVPPVFLWDYNLKELTVLSICYVDLPATNTLTIQNTLAIAIFFNLVIIVLKQTMLFANCNNALYSKSTVKKQATRWSSRCKIFIDYWTTCTVSCKRVSATMVFLISLQNLASVISPPGCWLFDYESAILEVKTSQPEIWSPAFEVWLSSWASA